MSKASDLREKSVEDLKELRASLAHDTFQNRLKNFTNRLDDTSAIRKNKRALARVITLLREREIKSPAAAPAAAARPAAKAKAAKAPRALKARVKKPSKKTEAKQS